MSEHRAPCRLCDGDGKVLASVADQDAPVLDSCPDCRGTGWRALPPADPQPKTWPGRG